MKRILRIVLGAVASAAALLFLVYALRGVIIEPRLRNFLAETIESSLGLRVSIGDISGSYLASLELKDIRTLERGTTGPVTLVEAERIGARYSLLSLLSGLDAFLGALEIELDKARVELALTGEAEEKEKPPEEASKGGPLSLPAVLPKVSVRDASVLVQGEGYSIDAEGIGIVTRPGEAPGLTAVEAGAKRFLLVHPAIREEVVSLSATLAYDGAGIDIAQVSLGGGDLVTDGRIELAGLPGKVEAGVETVLFSRRLDLSLAFEESVIDLTLKAEGFDLDGLFSVLLVPETEISGILDAEAAVRLDTGSLGQMEGDLALEWHEAAVAGFSADTLRGKASAGKGRLTVENLEAESEGNLVSVAALGLSLEALLGGEWNALVDSLEGGFSLALEDLPGLLSQGGVTIPGVKDEVPPHLIALEGRVGNRTLTLSDGRLEVGSGLVEMKTSSLVLPAPGAAWGSAALHLDLTADLPDLSLLGELFPLPPLEGSLDGEVFLDGAFESLGGRVTLSSRGLAVDGRRVEEATLEGEADSRRMTIHSAAIRVGEGAGDLEVRELSASSKDLFAGEWRALLAGMTGALTLRSDDIPAVLDALGVPGPEEEVLDHRLELEARIGEGVLEVSRGLLETATGKLLLERARIVFPEGDVPWSETEMEISFDAEVPDLGEAGKIVGMTGLAGSLRGKIEADGALESLKGAASLEGVGLAYGDIFLGDLSLEAEADRSDLRLMSLRLSQEGALLMAKGGLDIPARTVEELSLSLQVENIDTLTGGLTEVDHGGALKAELTAGGTLDSLEGTFDLAFGEGRFGSVEIPEMLIKGSLAGTRVVIDEARAETSQGSVALAGELEAKRGEGRYYLRLRELALSREGLEMGLDSPAAASYSPEGITVDSLQLSGAPGSIRLSGGMPREGETLFTLEASGLSSEGWLEVFVGDRLSFSGGEIEVRVSGSLTQPTVALTGRVAELRGRGAPYPLAGEIEAGYSSAGIEVRTFSWSTPNARVVDVTGTLPLDPLADDPLLPAELAVTVILDIPDLREISFLLPEGYGVDGRLEGGATISGTWEKPLGDIRIKVSDLTLPDTVRPAPPGKLSIECELEATRDAMALRKLGVDSPRLSAEASGTWSGAPAPLAVARGEEELLQGDLNLKGRLEVSSMAWLSRGIDAVRNADGALTVTFSAEGPVGKPEFTGEADLEDLGMRFGGIPPLTDVNGSLSLRSGTLSVSGLEGDLGGAPFEFSGTVDGIGEDDPEFDLSLKGESLLLYRDEGVRVRADADLAARGPLSKLGISGSAMITDSRYVKNIDLLGSVGGHKAPKVQKGGPLFSFRDPPLRDLVFDLRLGAKDPFVIRNQFIRAFVSPNLRLTGTGNEPAMKGRVTIDEYRAVLPTGIMRGEQGLVVFTEAEPARPWLEVTGETRMMGYDITMLITGFADEPQVLFTSSPPLPGDEVLLMVLAGTPPRSSDRPVAASTGTAFSIFLARGFLSRFFGGDPEATDEMLLDRLDTQIGRDITESGDPTIESTLRMKDNFLLEGGSLYLTGERDRFDDFNYGVRFGIDFQNKDSEYDFNYNLPPVTESQGMESE